MKNPKVAGQAAVTAWPAGELTPNVAPTLREDPGPYNLDFHVTFLLSLENRSRRVGIYGGREILSYVMRQQTAAMRPLVARGQLVTVAVELRNKLGVCERLTRDCLRDTTQATRSFRAEPSENRQGDAG